MERPFAALVMQQKIHLVDLILIREISQGKTAEPQELATVADTISRTPDREEISFSA